MMQNQDMGCQARRSRMIIVGVALLLGMALVLARAVQVQIFNGAQLKSLAEDQYLREIKLSAPRGSVFDRAGRALAVSVDVESVYVDPHKLDRSRLADLAHSLGLKTRILSHRIGKRRTFAWVKRRVSPRQASAVRALMLPGVHFTQESRRFYPNRELAAHVLGFVGLDGKGLSGLERSFDDQLRGRTVRVDTLRDARGRPVSTGEPLPVMTLEGNDVYLTIDAALQHTTEQILARTVAQHAAVAGMAVVLDPQTGAIRALANVPTFNPNEAGRAKAATRRNRVVTDVFEPGSTVKPLVVAAALQRGLIRETETIDCEHGSVRIGKHSIRDSHPHDRLSISEVISKSSNIGALKIGLRLGAKRLYSDLRSFGFGQRSDSKLAGEVVGLMAKPQRWSKVRTATISFGQGLSVTALQLVAAIATLASGGVYHPPYVVDHIQAHDGTLRYQHDPDSTRTVVAPEVAQAVVRMMEKVVEPGGTAPRARIKGLRIAGKTGTAQKVNPMGGGYSEDKRIASFVAFAPAEDPKLVVLVVVDEPQDVSYGGVVAAPAVREILIAGLPSLGVSLDETLAHNSTLDSAFTTPAEALANPGPRPQAKAPVVSGLDVPLHSKGSMPDLRGLLARQALEAAIATGLEVSLNGSGRVVKQKPAPGAALRKVQEIRLVLGEERGG